MTKRNTKNKNLNVILLWLGAIELVAMLAITFYFVQRNVDIVEDKARFTLADHKEYGVFDVTVSKISASSLRVAEKKICYRSEQKFWGGKTRCQTASAAYFAQELPEREVRRYFIGAVEAMGAEVDKSSPNDTFIGAKDLPCRLEIYRGGRAANPGHFLPKEPAAKQTIVVACDAAAKANHYPFVKT